MTNPIGGVPEGRPSVSGHLAGAILTIDLGALADNYRRLRRELNGVDCAAVVKADAYGIGLDQAAPALWAAGAREFFVAHPGEGIHLRELLPEAKVYVLNSPMLSALEEYQTHRLTPALNSLGDIGHWWEFCGKVDQALPAVLHVDTGMCRLGLDLREYAALAADPALLDGLNIELVMSHLASADEKDSQQSSQQLSLFHNVRNHVPQGRASFAASSGIFLGGGYHFDLGRPGVALYGVNPTPWTANPMAQVVRLQGKILQVRDVDTPETVGYGASHRIEGQRRIATLPVGYADGYLRGLSSRAKAHIGDIEVPLVGRVSMDLITLDVTNVPERLCRPGQLVDLIGPHHTVDDLATEAGTIGYEILTSLGNRYHRVYKTAQATQAGA